MQDDSAGIVLLYIKKKKRVKNSADNAKPSIKTPCFPTYTYAMTNKSVANIFWNGF